MKAFHRFDRTTALGTKVLFFVFTTAALSACGDAASSIDLPPCTSVDCKPDETTPAPAAATYVYSLSAPRSETSLPSTSQIRIRGELLPTSLAADEYYRYDVYVLTAQASATATITTDVIDANPDGYPFGYAYPLSLSRLDTRGTLRPYAYNYLKNALDDGHAVTQYDLEAGKQYVLVYKTFDKFTPLTYELTLPDSVRVEGYVTALAMPVSDPTVDDTPITLASPHPRFLSRIVAQIRNRAGL